MSVLSRTNVYTVHIVIMLLCLTRGSYGTYNCLCNYAVESSVFPEPNSTLTPLGYMYEFDCKPLSTPQQTNGYFIIQFQHQVAYLPAGVEDQLQVQICQGDIPTDDIVTTAGTPMNTGSHTNKEQSTVVSIVHTSTVGSPVDVNTTYSKVTPSPTQPSTPEAANNTAMTTDSSLASITNTTESSTLTLPELNTTDMPLDPMHTSPRPDVAFRLPSTVSSSISNGSINMTTSTYNVSTTSSTGSVFVTSTSNETNPIPDSIAGTEGNSTATTGDTFKLTTESSLDPLANTTKSATQILTALNTTTITPNSLTVISTTDIASSIHSSASLTDISGHSSLKSTSDSYTTTIQASMSSTLSAAITATESMSVPKITTETQSTVKVNTTKALGLSTEISPTGQSLTVSMTSTFIETNATSTSTIPSTTIIPSTTQPTTLPTTQLPQTTTEAPITWPRGTYGLMEAAQGCPDDGYTTWSEGWRYQDTEGAIPIPFVTTGNQYTYGIRRYMRGEFDPNNIKTYFCMKRRHDSNTNDRDWPRGSYCILKYGPCPKGFMSGSVFWDDVFVGNHDDKGGSLPEGRFDTETEIFYCCRDDGPVSTSIVLPTAKPFILLRYSETCQTVKGMSAYDIFIYWDDQNTFNSDKVTGMHPYDDGNGRNHRLHFCYYSASSSTGSGPGLVGR